LHDFNFAREKKADASDDDSKVDDWLVTSERSAESNDAWLKTPFGDDENDKLEWFQELMKPRWGWRWNRERGGGRGGGTPAWRANIWHWHPLQHSAVKTSAGSVYIRHAGIGEVARIGLDIAKVAPASHKTCMVRKTMR
jgi:hypothetical protein